MGFTVQPIKARTFRELERQQERDVPPPPPALTWQQSLMRSWARDGRKLVALAQFTRFDHSSQYERWRTPWPTHCLVKVRPSPKPHVKVTRVASIITESPIGWNMD